jgi:hypothetical protein
VSKMVIVEKQGVNAISVVLQRALRRCARTVLKCVHSHCYALCNICEERLLAYSCLSVCSHVLIKQLGPYWKDFREVWYWGVFTKICPPNYSFDEIGRSDTLFTRRPTYVSGILPFTDNCNIIWQYIGVIYVSGD